MSDMADASRTARYREYLKAELEAAALYRSMAEVEPDPRRAQVFERLVQAEMRHASRWAEKLGMDTATLQPARPGLKARLFGVAARMLGTSRVVPWLVRSEAKGVTAYAADPEARDLAREERRHARVLKEMADGQGALATMRAEGRHIMADGGTLRAAVLGVNDGLVSNFSLVMGVAGGISNREVVGGISNSEVVLLAGVAGLLAGAFSMATGEYVSMRSQRDLYEYQIAAEEAELLEWPEEEEEELVLIYQAKGLSREESERIAKRIMERPEVALETMAREELGLDPSRLGSPWGAAISSFLAFVVGAIVPILPYIFDAGTLAFALSGVFGATSLLLVGGTLAGVTGKSVVWGGLRMLLAGGVAAAVTFGVGRLIGVSIGL